MHVYIQEDDPPDYVVFLAASIILLFLPLGLLAVAVALQVNYVSLHDVHVQCRSCRHIMTTRLKTTKKLREKGD